MPVYGLELWTCTYEWKTPEEQNKHCTGFLMKRGSQVNHAPLGEILNTWTDVCLKAMNSQKNNQEWKHWTARCS